MAIQELKIDITDYQIAKTQRKAPSKKRQNSLKKAGKPLSHYLGNYNQFIKADIDQIWEQSDWDRNNWLDKNEAKFFLRNLSKHMDPVRVSKYDESKFDMKFK